jgi:hypothetical protein
MDWQARSSHCKSRCGSTAHKRIKVALTFCPSISIQLRTFLKDSMAIEMFHTMRLCSELVWKRQTTIWGGTDNDTEVVVLAQLQVYYTGWYRKNCIGSLHLALEVHDRWDQSAATGSGNHNHSLYSSTLLSHVEMFCQKDWNDFTKVWKLTLLPRTICIRAYLDRLSWMCTLWVSCL